MYQLLTLVLFLNGIGLQILGQNKESIDIELEECLSIESNMTTAGMTECTYTALDKWDAELNKYYKLLMTNLSEEGKSILKSSQREWIEYRDKEYAFIDHYYLSHKQGTMWIPIAASDKMELIKTRAIELRTYHETLEY